MIVRQTGYSEKVSINKKALPGLDGVRHPPPVFWIEVRFIQGT
jgi:hypothetical protein